MNIDIGNLKPGTKYHIQVQGEGESGSTEWSKIYTFVTSGGATDGNIIVILGLGDAGSGAATLGFEIFILNPAGARYEIEVYEGANWNSDLVSPLPTGPMYGYTTTSFGHETYMMNNENSFAGDGILVRYRLSGSSVWQFTTVGGHH